MSDLEPPQLLNSSGTDASSGPQPGERPPLKPPRISWPTTILWAVSPAIILTIFVASLGRDWPYLGWAAFFAGVINMGAFSVWQLWSRDVEGWEFKALALALGLLVGNLLLLMLASVILGIPVGGSNAASP